MAYAAQVARIALRWRVDTTIVAESYVQQDPDAESSCCGYLVIGQATGTATVARPRSADLVDAVAVCPLRRDALDAGAADEQDCGPPQ